MKVKPFWWLWAVAAVCWCYPLDFALLDWDEINFAAAAREMLLRRDFGQVTIGFLPFYEKPPLFFWCQALVMYLWDTHAAAARLPNALCGLLTLWLLYRWGGPRIGTYWACFYAASWLPQFYFRVGLIDPVFNLFIVGALYTMQTHPRRWYAVGGCLGLAVLTKGFAAWVVFVGVVGFCYRRGDTRWAAYALLLSAGVAAVYFWQTDRAFGWAFLVYQWELLSRPVAGHRGFLGYHAVVLGVGVFPAVVWAWPYLWRRSGYWWGLFWVVFVVFSLVQTKIIHYSSLCYFPLTYWAAQAWDKEPVLPLARRVLFGLLGGAMVVVVVVAPWAGLYLGPLLAWLEIKDAFLLALPGQGIVWLPWQGLGLGVGLALLLVWLGRGRSLVVASVGFLCWFQVTLAVFMPRILAYTQGPAVAFCEQHSGAYFIPVGFKTYTHFFYGQMPALPAYVGTDKKSRQDWLLSPEGPPDVYLIARLNRRPPQDERIRYLYTRGGYVFFEKKARQR
ncbi:MAG: ArnT family glycosyltransferase [Bernardetiaceae bacterium]